MSGDAAVEVGGLLKAVKGNKELIEGTFKEFNGRISGIESLVKDIDTRTRARKISLPGLDLEKEVFSFLKAINAIQSRDWSNAGFEKEVFEATRKAQSAGTGSSGGYIVPTQALADFIPMMRANSIIALLGATILSDLQGSPVEIPKQTGGATAYWVDENAEIPETSMSFGQLTLNPKAVAAIVKISNRLLKMSSPAIEAMIRRDIALVLALAIDLAALRGSGVGSEPLGLANVVGINTIAVGTNGGAFTLDHLSRMEGTLEDNNALIGSLGIAFHGKVKRLLKQQKVAQFSGDTGGQHIILPMSDANLKDIIGYNFATSSQIPTNLTKSGGSNLSEVYFGNWQELIIGQWGGMEILASSETSDAFAKNQTWIRIIQEVDVGIRHPGSFCFCNDAATI